MEMIVKKLKQNKNIWWTNVSPEQSDQIMELFWNSHENEAVTIAKKMMLTDQQVTKEISKRLDQHFNQIKKRVNKKL